MSADHGDNAEPATRFDVVVRGYDRRQVDEHLAGLERTIARQRADLEKARESGGRNGSAARGVGLFNTTTGGRAGGGAESAGGLTPEMISAFTTRLQSILQAAEDEAEEVRTNARNFARKEEDAGRARLAEMERRREALLAELSRVRGQLDGLLTGANKEAPIGSGLPPATPAAPPAPATPPDGLPARGGDLPDRAREVPTERNRELPTERTREHQPAQGREHQPAQGRTEQPKRPEQPANRVGPVSETGRTPRVVGPHPQQNVDGQGQGRPLPTRQGPAQSGKPMANPVERNGPGSPGKPRPTPSPRPRGAAPVAGSGGVGATGGREAVPGRGHDQQHARNGVLSRDNGSFDNGPFDNGGFADSGYGDTPYGEGYGDGPYGDDPEGGRSTFGNGAR